MALTQIKTLGIADDAVTLAKQASGTDGQIITYDASGNPTAVGPGTDGQVLTSTGAGSPPAFEDLPTSGPSLANDANNRVITGTGSGLNGEANLTFDGSTLEVKASAATANDLINAVNVNARTTGTAAAGVGTKMTFYGSMTGQDDVELGQIGFHNTNVSGAHGDFIVKTRPNGTSQERLRITSGGHVLIGDEGNDNAFFKAHAADGESDNLYVGQFINAEATAGNNYGVNIQGGSNSTDHGLRVKNHAGTSQLLVRGDGEVQIGSGDLVFGTAGKGVVLGSTSNTASNTLDDYEEGTFTPKLGGNANNSTYNVSGSGWYIKIGQIVHVELRFHGVDLDSNADGAVLFYDMPFTGSSAGTNPVCSAGVTTNFQTYYIDFNNGNRYSCYLSGNTTQWQGLKSRSNATWVDWDIDDFNVQNVLYIDFYGTYRTT